MDARTLVELKMALEFGVGPDGETLPLATNPQDDQPLVIVSAFDGGCRLYIREDVLPAIDRCLRDVGARRCFHDEVAVRDALASFSNIRTIRRIRWYFVTRRPSPAEFADVVVRDGRFVILDAGRPVSWAETDWEDERAAEVSIETIAEHRRRGFGRQVTAAWAASVVDAGKVGYYSHRMTNDASRAVAESLGLTHLADEVEYI